MADDVLIPHLQMPLSFATGPDGPRMQVVEQDSDEELTQCVETILRYPLGFRQELPEFGITDPVMRENGADVQEMVRAVTEWEPRVSAIASQELEELLTHITMEVRPRTDA